MEVVKMYRSTGNVYNVCELAGEICQKIDIDVDGLAVEVDNYGMEHFVLDGVPVTSITEVDGKVKVIAQYPLSDNAIVRFGKEL